MRIANSKKPRIFHSSIPQVAKTLFLFHLWMEKLSQMMEVCLSILAFFLLLMPCILAHYSRPQQNKNSCLQDILAAEHLNEWGELDRKHCQPKKCLKRDAKHVKVIDNLSDPDSKDDSEYQIDIADSATEANDALEDDISNGEVSARSSTIFTFLLFSNWL
jgi:hypothetical protein